MAATRTPVHLLNRRAQEARSRIQKLLRTAAREFALSDYHRVSLNGILRRSGGSKATLIKYFGSKAGLYAAVVSGEAQRSVEQARLAAGSQEPREALCAFGESVLRFYLRRDSINFYRGVIAQAAQEKQLAKAFYEGGHAQFVNALAALLTTWRDSGRLTCADPKADADRFLHMIRSGYYEQCLIGLLQQPSSRQLARHIRDSVALFLQGIGRGRD